MKTKFTLSAGEQSQIESLRAQSQPGSNQWLIASILLLRNAGVSLNKISEQLHVSYNTVRNVERRFSQIGLYRTFTTTTLSSGPHSNLSANLSSNFSAALRADLSTDLRTNLSSLTEKPNATVHRTPQDSFGNSLTEPSHSSSSSTSTLPPSSELAVPEFSSFVQGESGMRADRDEHDEYGESGEQRERSDTPGVKHDLIEKISNSLRLASPSFANSSSQLNSAHFVSSQDDVPNLEAQPEGSTAFKSHVVNLAHNAHNAQNAQLTQHPQYTHNAHGNEALGVSGVHESEHDYASESAPELEPGHQSELSPLALQAALHDGLNMSKMHDDATIVDSPLDMPGDIILDEPTVQFHGNPGNQSQLASVAPTSPVNHAAHRSGGISSFFKHIFKSKNERHEHTDNTGKKAEKKASATFNPNAALYESQVKSSDESDDSWMQGSFNLDSASEQVQSQFKAQAKAQAHGQGQAQSQDYAQEYTQEQNEQAAYSQDYAPAQSRTAQILQKGKSLSRGLSQGLNQGFSQGLGQGLKQGLKQGFSPKLDGWVSSTQLNGPSFNDPHMPSMSLPTPSLQDAQGYTQDEYVNEYADGYADEYAEGYAYEHEHAGEPIGEDASDYADNYAHENTNEYVNEHSPAYGDESKADYASETEYASEAEYAPEATSDYTGEDVGEYAPYEYGQGTYDQNAYAHDANAYDANAYDDDVYETSAANTADSSDWASENLESDANAYAAYAHEQDEFATPVDGYGYRFNTHPGFGGKHHRFIINLSPQEKDYLEHIVNDEYERNNNSTRWMKSCVLLLSDQGETVSKIAERLNLSKTYVSRIRSKFISLGLDELLTNHNTMFSEVYREHVKQLIKSLIEQPPRNFGYNSALWTSNTLQDYLWQNCERLGMPDLLDMQSDDVYRLLRRVVQENPNQQFYIRTRESKVRNGASSSANASTNASSTTNSNSSPRKHTAKALEFSVD